MNCEILISISLGDNFPLRDEFHSKDCKTHAILEAKFNDELLTSDPIEIQSPNPELATELGFRVNKKDFHQFRTEHKSIKLQCFVSYSTLIERHFIGYLVLHLRDAQDYTINPKYKWHILLNQKYKGSSNKRPQLYLALMVNKLNDQQNPLTNETDSLETSTSENIFTRSIKKEEKNLLNESIMSLSSYSNLQIEITNKHIYIWDKNFCDKNDCIQEFVINIQIDQPKYLINLLNEEDLLRYKNLEQAENHASSHHHSNQQQNRSHSNQYYFRYNIFGKEIKTKSFNDLRDCSDFVIHKHSVSLKTIDKNMLQEYFETYPTIEIQFCSLCHNESIGFVTINLLKLFHQNNSFIYGNFVVVPEEESTYIKDPFPVLSVRLFLFNKTKIDSYLERPIDYINHYYVAIDLRTIKIVTASNTQDCSILYQPFYLQFSYAFFGATNPIKTYPAIRFSKENPGQEITIPHGFCGFNLATTYEKLSYTLENLPLIIQLILEKDNTLLGTSEIDLKCLKFKKENFKEDNFVNINTFVKDELNDNICEIGVIMFIQELLDTVDDMGGDSDPNEFIQNRSEATRSPNQKAIVNKTESKSTLNRNCETKSLFISPTAKIITDFPNDQAKSSKRSGNNLQEIEKKLEILSKKLDERERILFEQEKLLDKKREEFEQKSKTDPYAPEIFERLQKDYEKKIDQLMQKFHSLEEEKFKHLERNYQLERKIKEKNCKIRELESKISQMTQMNRRKPQQNDLPSVMNARKIVITREE
ncbi:DUF3668 domain-containing protein [Sarcoptes scabiei]|uniref:DUF3668 domain-containing protein n=1 Tax=Sarcoptes scabiei TaxID=52283 RepID=A0A131ZVI7_SARSC|nr:DUF3668 domain-containing protein [Sarcoptes scabiei]